MRWLSIVLPVLFIGCFELLSDTVLDPLLPTPLDSFVVIVVTLVVATAASVFAFRAIDDLAARLQSRNAELEARNASARALHQVSVAITALADIDAILDATVDNARSLLEADIAVLALTGPEGRPELRAWAGSARAIEHMPSSGASDDHDDAARFIRPTFRRAILAAPLQRGGRTIGALVVGSRHERSYGIDDLETLSSLAIQAAVAIENDRLQRGLRDLAVRGERERIAREMHDGLAQVLGYVNTKSQAVEELLAAGRVVDAQGQMAELAAAARSIYVDVREAIIGLASPVLPERGLADALADYGRRFADASKIATTVTTTPAANGVELTPAVEGHVFRIVQEALTNVRKHAAAGRVEVSLDVTDGRLAVTVTDDGRGFDPGSAGSDEAEWPHFGRRTMRERAAAAGGTVEWESRTGAGTTVRVSVPVAVVTPAGVGT